MTQIEKDIAEIKETLALIKKALGIGMAAPTNIVDIKRRAAIVADKIRKKYKDDPPSSN